MTHRANALSVIMPVYNEGDGIATVIATWQTVLSGLHVPYEVRVYDDGSTDDTGAVLDGLAERYPEMRVTHQSNRGHGPTVLRGYRDATGVWVFQVDGDDEIPASMFGRVWDRRQGADAVFGVRTDRPGPLSRRLMTWGAWIVVRASFGECPVDVNVPFRLIRREMLTRVIRHLPDTLFAPNVAVAGLLGRCGARLVEVPVTCRARPTGTSTLVGTGKVMKVALRAAGQTLQVAARARGIPV